MCVRTLSSDPAHLLFSLNCLPNEEEIKKITYQHIFQQTTKRIKQSTLKGLCGYHNITTRKDGNKNQIVTNTNYGQNSLFIFLKTTNDQIKLGSDKIYTQKIIRLFFEQNMGLVLNATWQQVD